VKDAPLIVLDHVDDTRRPDLLALFASAWWASARADAAVARMLAGSDVVVALVDPACDRMVGFARAISDQTFLAVVLDVIVDPNYRGQGLGKRLVDELLASPGLASVDSVELVCQPELIPFYRGLGFSEEVGRSLLMRRTANPLLQADQYPS
jgi:ribosomal protein S18 acetylase RimI-like enzyme